jgi:hypothetical protein
MIMMKVSGEDARVTAGGDAGAMRKSGRYQLPKGTTWVEIPGIASAIAVSPDFGVPWYVDTVVHIFE